MTETGAIGAALERAGFDYVKFQLDRFLRNYILAGGTEQILVARFRAVAEIIAKEMAAGKISFVKSAESKKPIASGDQVRDVPQDHEVVVPARDPIPGGEANGRLPARAKAVMPPAGKPPLIAKKGQRKPAKPRSEARREAALWASKVSYDAIFDREIGAEGPLGNIAVGRLHAIAEERAIVGAGYQLRSHREVADAVLCEILSGHCVAADPFTKIKEAIPTKIVKQAAQTAEVRAAEFLRDNMARFATDIIAIAHRPIPAEIEA